MEKHIKQSQRDWITFDPRFKNYSEELNWRRKKMEELRNASAALLYKINNITTEEFSKGGEKKERNYLAEVLDSCSLG